MRKTFVGIFLLLAVQGVAQFEYKKRTDLGPVASWMVDMSDPSVLDVRIVQEAGEAPEVGTDALSVKKQLDRQRAQRMSAKYKTEPYRNEEEMSPEVLESFIGLPGGLRGTPLDNSLAVSNNGIIISVINQSVTMLDSTGQVLRIRSLSSIVQGQLGTLDWTYDPKVLYDPIADRFILVFLDGTSSSQTRIVLGFSGSNDPLGTWYFYALNGNPLGGGIWSDYPIIAHNKEDFFVTINLLRDGESWQEGFVQSLIWQVNKADGYTGDTLGQQFFHDIRYNGKPVWSICPVQPGDDLERTDMHFLSVRPGDASNDTVFLHSLNNTYSSGEAQLQMRVLKMPLMYGVPPSAYQPSPEHLLQTNDARVLSATLYRDEIHFVQTTVLPDLSSGVYHGQLREVHGNTTVHADYIEDPDLDLAYPSITYTGLPETHYHSMIMTFSHSGTQDYPGTSMVYFNRVGELGSAYSPLMRIKEGEGFIDRLSDSLERWGDYTDIQRQYNRPGVVWLVGSFGDAFNLNNVWIAKVKASNELQTIEEIIAYPNPAQHQVHLSMNFETATSVDVELIDLSGKRVQERKGLAVAPATSHWSLSTDGLSNGTYILRVVAADGTVLHTRKVVVSRG